MTLCETDGFSEPLHLPGNRWEGIDSTILPRIFGRLLCHVASKIFGEGGLLWEPGWWEPERELSPLRCPNFRIPSLGTFHVTPTLAVLFLEKVFLKSYCLFVIILWIWKLTRDFLTLERWDRNLTNKSRNRIARALISYAFSAPHRGLAFVYSW